MDQKRGAYVLYFDIELPLTLQVGSLGSSVFPAGRYAYVGSARRGIAARVLRHKRLALQKEGKLHWHIDYLLINRHTELAGRSSTGKRNRMHDIQTHCCYAWSYRAGARLWLLGLPREVRSTPLSSALRFRFFRQRAAETAAFPGVIFAKHKNRSRCHLLAPDF